MLGRYKRNYSYTKKRQELFEELVDFSETNGIPPTNWLVFLFERRSWQRPPFLSHQQLMSPKSLEAYRTQGAHTSVIGFQAFQGFKQTDGVEKLELDPRRDLFKSVENRKSQLVSMSELCMAKTFSSTDPTYGFHPRSKVCQGCSKSAECEKSLIQVMGKNIVRLRKGEISMQQYKGTLND